MSERDEVLLDLAERARFFASLTTIGVPPLPPVEPSALTPASTVPDLKAVREELGDCQRCKLARGRKNIVFGQGNPHAELMFVGEAPGADEDEQGLAFVGKAGQLLTRIIEAIQLRREDVYICNIIKCRPPGNRNPEADEIAACEPFLKAQLAAIKPKLICCLGTFAAQTLLRSKEPISRLRGRFHTYQGIPLLPTEADAAPAEGKPTRAKAAKE